MFETITEKIYPDIWQLILKIAPEYPHKEARYWKKNYMGLVAQYLDAGFMCTYYIVQNGNIERIPDKPEDDSPIEFMDIPKRALGFCTGIHPKGISIIDIYSEKTP